MKSKEEIQPEDIWNDEKLDMVKEHILNHIKNKSPEDIVETELAAKKYTEEDVIRLMFNATKWDTFKEDEVGYNMTLSQYFNYCLHSLNKQD